MTTPAAQAMDRRLVGRPQRTDGRLVKDNLWKEAQVSRATLSRAARIMADWGAGVAACGRGAHCWRGTHERRPGPTPRETGSPNA